MDNLLGVGRGHSTRRRGRDGLRAAATLAAAGLVLAGGGIAFADDIYTTLDSTIDAEAEILALNAGTTGSTNLAIQPRNGDGETGCNVKGDWSVTLNVVSSDPTVATVSPATIVLPECGVGPELTISALKAGTAHVSASVASTTSPGSFNTGPAAFRVDVTAPAPANTAPALYISGVTNGASYAKGSVPAAVCQVRDTEDGDSSFPATLGAVSGPDGAYGVGTQEASCSYTDDGGITVAGSVTYGITDPTPPAVGYTLTPAAPDGANGWYKSAVTLDWTVTEGDSPSTLVLNGCEDRTVSDDQAATGYGCTASSSGGAAAPVTVSLKKDGTAPTVAFDSTMPDSYFGSTPAAPGCTASDAMSGLAGACTVSGYSASVGAHTLTATATDLAGNTSTVTQDYEVKAWTLRGFYQPVDMSGVLNTVKGGSTVPAKFEVFAGESEITDPGVLGFSAAKIQCTTGATEDAIETVVAGNTSLRYDATAGQFIYNWKTPTGAGNCYRLTMTAADGGTLFASFKLK